MVRRRAAAASALGGPDAAGLVGLAARALLVALVLAALAHDLGDGQPDQHVGQQREQDEEDEDEADRGGHVSQRGEHATIILRRCLRTPPPPPLSEPAPAMCTPTTAASTWISPCPRSSAVRAAPPIPRSSSRRATRPASRARSRWPATSARSTPPPPRSPPA